ncbi:hypothetical protein [Flavobacterium poyangense]|uniref:hypothetical protein n=1 Tax=Flavobacterium poyangense TaxID=2204302 RepID=UPI00141FAD91|nr:hypothetical protein [Flavobacterium sp. JXAS1]
MLSYGGLDIGYDHHFVNRVNKQYVSFDDSETEGMLLKGFEEFTIDYNGVCN